MGIAPARAPVLEPAARPERPVPAPAGGDGPGGWSGRADERLGLDHDGAGGMDRLDAPEGGGAPDGGGDLSAVPESGAVDGEGEGEELAKLLDERFESAMFRERLDRYLQRYRGCRRHEQWQVYFELCELMAAQDPMLEVRGSMPDDDGVMGWMR